MKRKKLTEADVTAESVFMLKRRQVLKMLGISATALSLPAARPIHVGRIRRSRRIRQWRGADAGCDACRVLSSLRERTCRADKAFTPHPPVARCRCRMRRLSRLIQPTGTNM